MSVSILHLSDIHAGKGELELEDKKVAVPGAERLKQLPRLASYLRALPKAPDFVVISGDLTIRSDQSGLDEVRRWLLELIGENVLPPASRILVTPGNHDVSRRQRREEEDRLRFERFWTTLGRAFPHAHIPGWDPALDYRRPAIKAAPGELVGGIKTATEFDVVKLKESHPFVLDLEHDVLIFAFNSALACGVPIDPNNKILEPMKALATLMPEQAGTINQVIKEYLDSLVVDAGMVGEPQIQYFVQLMGRLRSELKGQYERLTKIAFLHHHISHLWDQQLELKTFEATIDASQLKRALVENGFDFVLHGHKHTNHVGIDGSLISISDARPLTPLCIVSAGTIAGHPRTNDTQTFKLLRLEGDKGPRVRATVTEIPLKDAANYADAVGMGKIYHAPISQKLPRLHEIASTKQALDQAVVESIAPEMHPANAQVVDRALVPSSLSKLVSATVRYRCYGRFETTDCEYYVDLFLATRKLGFSDTSRIYWLLSDLRERAGSNGKRVRVLVLIGSLEGTHFSQVESVGEVDRSIEGLQKQFAPAIDSGLLEIRVCRMTQDEVEAVARKAAAS